MAVRGQETRTAAEARTAEAMTEYGELLSRLARRWAGRRVTALTGYRQILAEYGTGRTDSRATASAVAKLTAEEAVKYPGELLDLASDYASGLAKVAGLTATGARTDDAPTKGRTVHDLTLSGKIGDTASAEILIENPREADVTIGFASTAFSNEERVTKLTPSFDPKSCTLTAGSEQKVIVSAKLDGRTVKAGESYSAQAVVDGFDDMVLRLHLAVEPA